MTEEKKSTTKAKSKSKKSTSPSPTQLTPQATDLKLSVIKSQAEAMFEQESYELKDGSTITFYPIFPELLIEDMLEELQKHYVEMNEKGVNLSQKMTIYFIQLMTIKHFTHLGKSMPDTFLGENEQPGLFDYLNYLANTGLLKTIVEEVFMKEQMQKVYGKLTDIISTSQLNNRLEQEVQKKFETLNLKNKDVFEQINKMSKNETKNKLKS